MIKFVRVSIYVIYQKKQQYFVYVSVKIVLD